MPSWLTNSLPPLSIALEIAILAAMIYAGLRFIRRTRSATILAGITILLTFLSLISHLFRMEVLGLLMLYVWKNLPLAVIIIFSPEIRRGLGQIGLLRRSFMQVSEDERRQLIRILTETVAEFSRKRTGALVALERSVGLRNIVETGIPLNARLSKEVLATIFHPNTPLHDGGVVIHGTTIVAAGCIFPLTQAELPDPQLGTRHRAGIGLSEETDSIVIIVSEETGRITLACQGKFKVGCSPKALEAQLDRLLLRADGGSGPAPLFLRQPVSDELFDEEEAP